MTEYRDQFLEAFVGAKLFNMDNLANVGVMITATAMSYCIASAIYNVFFHPLRSFPGPVLFRSTALLKAYHNIRGDMGYRVKELHEKYGPVVRISPNEQKWEGFCAFKGLSSHRSIVTAHREEHSLLRRQLSHGFAERSMQAQEPFIRGYVDLLISQLHEHAKGGAEALDLKQWVSWTTFDIVGNLAFGSDFGSLETAEDDPWVRMVAENIRTVAVMQSISALGFGDMVSWVNKMGLIPSHAEHEKRTRQKMVKRMQMDAERPDLIEGLSLESVQSNASALVVAGSETTATLLSGAIFLLTSNPDKLQKLQEEVRSAFNNEDEITLISVQRLSYMLACLDEEALRCYPPVMTGLPRVTPKGETMICGRQIPENTVVAVWQWAINRDPTLWTDPDEFVPERFMGDPKFANDNFQSLQPFSLGPRNCLGRNLAYSEMRLILARIVYNFDMKLSETSKDWLRTQKAYFVWHKPRLNVHLFPVSRH